MKEKGNEDLKDLSKWNEITKGLYRYVIGSNVAYEIHLLYHDKKTDILTAKSSLFIVGDWYKIDKETNKQVDFFERECLLKEGDLKDCLNEAFLDDINNNNN
jgi:hypothetical protein